MAVKRTRSASRRPAGNQRRTRVSFSEAMIRANRRAHEEANRRSGRKAMKSVRAAISSMSMEDDYPRMALTRQLKRVMLALLLLPFCWVTTWTFLSRFDASIGQGFWQSRQFWYFATGMLWMLGWFAVGLGRNFLLYVYVLGHELTHALCVWCFLGRVTGFSASVEGGYITTTKTNLIIALSPYFMPFWAVVVSVVYALVRHFAGLSAGWDLLYYGLLGVTWTFHMVWTLWMLPRDQPDLKEHGTFFSLVLIYLVNLLLLVGLLCLAADSPLADARSFVMEWIKWSATWFDGLWRWGVRIYDGLKASGKL